MVSMALKPHYRSKTISREQYTETNRAISRMLYDRVGTVETLSPEARTDLENTANFEVQKIVGAIHKKNKEHRQKLKQKQPMASADSDGDIQ
jgi:predicted choloylglycine hydrolase